MYTVLVLISLLGAALGAPRQVGRIVGGTETTVAQYPYMSNMQRLYDELWWRLACGGSVLTSRTILSAAHCFYRDTINEWRVRLGTSYATSGGTVHNVAALILHEQYVHATHENDVAIVVLASPTAIGGSVGTARIAGPNYHLPDNTEVTVIGWGALSSSGPFPENLQHVQVYIINHAICTERYLEFKRQQHAIGNFGWNYEVDAGMFCSGVLDVGGRDACQGDSGGPVAIETDIIYGITSWGAACAHELYPGVNARVSYYSDWIVQHGSV